MYVVMTRVELKPGTHERCAELFQRTNPGLVKEQPDWLGAQMIFDNETNVLTVLATWRDTKSYERLISAPEFQNTMALFAEFFAGPPDISLNQVLVAMQPESTSR